MDAANSLRHALGAMTRPAPTARLGFCCKFLPPPPAVHADLKATRAAARAWRDETQAMNVTSVTIANMQRLAPAEARTKLTGVIAHNIAALARQIAWVAARPPLERLLRLASSLLPAYTHPAVSPLYAEPELRALVERGLAQAGDLARAGGVRLSMHPGPFCILGTASPSALTNAIEDLDYHGEVMALMGYAGGWHPHGAHVNIHVGARDPGVAGFRANLARVSQQSRNLVTVENDENCFGLDTVLALADVVPVVFDIHHHWVETRGQYLEPDDPRIPRIVESWRGVRPVSHVSVSRESLLPGHDPHARPDFEALVAGGVKGRDLAAHSDMMWNEALNALVARHLAWTDFEIEAKAKNLASQGIARSIKALAASTGAKAAA